MGDFDDLNLDFAHAVGRAPAGEHQAAVVV
jgi:hypothetical protein